MKQFKFDMNTLPLSGKIAITLFLILLWYGYLLAALNAKLSVGVTVGAIAEHYAGQTLTSEEAQEIEERGFAEEEVVIGEQDHGDHDPMTMTKESESITPQEMVQMGHIHILGFSLLFITLGTVLFLSGIGEWVKIVILFLLFLSFSLDIGGLLLVRFIAGSFAILTFISGIGIGIGIAAVSLIALYDMWLRRPSTLST